MLANVFRAAVICFLSMTIVSTSSLARDNRRRVKRSLHGRVFAGLFATSGRRGAMEDENVISTTDDASIAAVFDGHGGGEVSSTLKRNFMKYLANQEGIKSGGSDQTLANAVLRALKSIDADVSKVPELSRQGSTAAVLLVNTYRALQTDGANTNHPSLIAVNVGDSRIVLCRAGRAVDLSIDHKPNTTSERARIEGVGGLVVWTGLSDPESGEHLIGTGVYRVNGVLALSRAIGDSAEKPAMSSEADYLISEGSALDEFAIVASDGLWDVFSSQEAVDFMHQIKRELWDKRRMKGLSMDLKAIESFLNNAARSLVETALSRGSTDNVTVLLLVFGERFLFAKPLSAL